MSVTVTSPATGVDEAPGSVARQPRTPGPLIDCDLHAEIDSLRDLFPFLSARWRKHIEIYGTAGYAGQLSVPMYPGCGYPRYFDHREDARPPSGRKAGSEAGFTGVDHLDRHNIAYGILNTITEVTRITNLDLDVALAAALNDWLTASWLDQDERFLATIVISCEDPPRAVEEIHRRGHDRRFVQVAFSGRPHEPMGRRKYWPIYEACAEYGLAVMTHAFGSAGNPISGAGWPSFYLEDHLGPAVAIQANVTSMIFESVFDHFPALKLVSVENTFGWAPALAWRLDNAWSLLKDEVPQLTRLPSEYLAERVYLATQPVEEAPTRRHFDLLLGQWPAFQDRLVFSSDYPHWDGDSPERALAQIRSDEVRRKIYYSNACELYGLQ
jgi:uncharacterized protein